MEQAALRNTTAVIPVGSRWGGPGDVSREPLCAIADIEILREGKKSGTLVLAWDATRSPLTQWFESRLEALFQRTFIREAEVARIDEDKRREGGDA